jgi:hypothetical protein
VAKFKLNFKLEDRDRGYKKIMAELSKAARGAAYTKVGVMADKNNRHAGDPIDSVGIGIVHEFGAPSIGVPERSWLRSTVTAKKAEWFSLARQLIELIYVGKMTVTRALGLIGAQAANDVKAHITEGEGIPPPNAASTIARKLGPRGPRAEVNATEVDTENSASSRRGRSSESLSLKYLRAIVSGRGVRTLVDSGRFLGSITWAVVVGGNEKGGGE